MNFEKDLRKQIIQLLNDGEIKFNDQDSIHGLLMSFF